MVRMFFYLMLEVRFGFEGEEVLVRWGRGWVWTLRGSMRRVQGGGKSGDVDVDVQLVRLATVGEGSESLAFCRPIWV